MTWVELKIGTQTIPTCLSRPLRQLPRRVTHSVGPAVEEQVDQMLAEGAIRPLSSACASPVVLLKKRQDGKHRLRVD